MASRDKPRESRRPWKPRRRVQGEDLWWKGPRWLAERENWPHDILTSVTPESQAEAKVSREVFGGARNVTDEFDLLLEKFALWKTLRVCAWIQRFVRNSRKRKEERSVGPLTSEEIEKQKHFRTARAQSRRKRSEKLDDNKLQLNLQERSDGLLECRGRIQGITLLTFPIHTPIPRNWQCCHIWSRFMEEWVLR